MGFMVSVLNHKRYIIFLNLSFLVLCSFLLITHFNLPEFHVRTSSKLLNPRSDQQACNQFQSLKDYKSKCHYLKSHDPCVSEGFIDYLHIFYCSFGSVPFLGHLLLFLWLLVLFYLLGNTASEYFCSSLENLSGLLRLSPVIAGVTLLSLGNGAPDVFASLVSFMGSGTCNVGFNTVLGGASFVTCVVVGLISILVKQKEITVNKFAFIRDVGFFFIVLATLSFILLHGKINIWGSIGFMSIYIFYVIIVYSSDILWSKFSAENVEKDANLSYGSDLRIPILCSLEKQDVEEDGLQGVVHSDVEMNKSCSAKLLVILEMPLYLPRRLTIPVVSEQKWSKPIAVTSVTLAPVLLSFLWNPEVENGIFRSRLVVCGIGLLFGVTFGVLAYTNTEKSNPPNKCLFPWLAGGFIMSVVWSYLVAQELVALLVSMGFIFQINPSILGLTVLAWGNSVGDLITNLTMALNSGPEGVQVAMSGCYAGPIFNILFGLGLSLVGSAWYKYPSPVVIPRDPYLLETLMFLIAGLIWALVILPSRKMKLDGVLGGGLVVIYLVSMSIRLMQTLGSLQFQGTHIPFY